MRVAILFISALAAGFVPMLWAAKALDSPLQAAVAFCFSQNQEAAAGSVNLLLAQVTQKQLRRAEQLDMDITSSRPDLKGPMGDWVPRGFQDRGACRVVSVQHIGETAQATINYQYSKTESSRDVLLLSKERGQWKIFDILYGPFRVRGVIRWPDDKNSLRDHLNAVLEQKE